MLGDPSLRFCFDTGFDTFMFSHLGFCFGRLFLVLHHGLMLRSGFNSVIATRSLFKTCKSFSGSFLSKDLLLTKFSQVCHLKL